MQKPKSAMVRIKKAYGNYIALNMWFQRLIFIVCSLSVALNVNGKLLNPAETARLRLSSGIHNSF